MMDEKSAVNPRNVHVKIEFIKVGEIDNMNEKYGAEVQITSKWHEFEQEIVDYNPSKHWNPMLYVENTLNNSKEQIKYSVERIDDHYAITEIRTVKSDFWERLELHNFPVDLQELNVILTTKLTADQITLNCDSENITLINREAKRTFVDQQKWYLFKIVKTSNTYQEDMGSSESIYNLIANINDFNKFQAKSPKLVGTCYCSRRPGFYFFNAISLIFLITASALTVFSINYKLPANRLQTTYTILLASISFKWVINRSLPPVSYLTSLDKYAIVCIFYVCVLAGWHGLIGSFGIGWEDSFSRRLDKCVLILFALMFIVIHLVGVVWLRVSTGKIRVLLNQEKQYVKKHMNSLKAKSMPV